MSNQARTSTDAPTPNTSTLRGVAAAAAGAIAATTRRAALILSLVGVVAVQPAAWPRPRVEPRPGAVPLASAPAQTVELTLPFQGIWGVVQGMNSGDTHVGYAAYALDFVPAEKLAGARPEKDRHRLTDFPCYGQPVLASADGQVVWARDGAKDPPPRRPGKRTPGNFLIIQHAPGEFTELRHLRQGSVRVKVGDRVARGEAVASCGNSGNAGTPHLHIGLLGSANPIATRPLRFSRYEVLGPGGVWQVGDGVPAAGQLVRSMGSTLGSARPTPAMAPAGHR